MSIYNRQKQNAIKIVHNKDVKLPIDFDLFKTLAAYNNKIKISEVTLRQREEAKLSMYRGQFEPSFKFPLLIELLEYYTENK
jgi:hypothetical protein